MASLSEPQKPVLVTGAAGFIGFALARRLLENGRAVVGVDCVNHSSTLRYLPVMGTYISLAVNEAATESVSWGPHRLHREPSFTTATTHALALLWSA